MHSFGFAYGQSTQWMAPIKTMPIHPLVWSIEQHQRAFTTKSTNGRARVSISLAVIGDHQPFTAEVPDPGCGHPHKSGILASMAMLILHPTYAGTRMAWAPVVLKEM